MKRNLRVLAFWTGIMCLVLTVVHLFQQGASLLPELSALEWTFVVILYSGLLCSVAAEFAVKENGLFEFPFESEEKNQTNLRRFATWLLLVGFSIFFLNYGKVLFPKSTLSGLIMATALLACVTRIAAGIALWRENARYYQRSVLMEGL